LRDAKLTPRRKQLILLLVAAAWISLVVIVEFSRQGLPEFDAPLLDYPLWGSFVWSLPVVLFCGVLFCYFGKREHPMAEPAESVEKEGDARE
jgi:hypothetical protein